MPTHVVEVPTKTVSEVEEENDFDLDVRVSFFEPDEIINGGSGTGCNSCNGTCCSGCHASCVPHSAASIWYAWCCN